MEYFSFAGLSMNPDKSEVISFQSSRTRNKAFILSQPLIAIEERNDNLGKECGDTKNSGKLYFYVFCVNTGAVKEDLVSTVTSLDSFIIIRDGATAAAVYGDVLDDYDEAGGDDQIVGDVSN